MKGVVMAGGRASRFRTPTEKGTLMVGGRTLLERAVDALQARGVDDVIVAVSRNTPRTTALAERIGIVTMDTGGTGYHEDAAVLIERLGSFVSLNVDVPFARRAHIEELVSRGPEESVAVVVPASVAIRPWDPSSITTDGSGEELLWAGLNVVTRRPTTSLLRIADPLLSVNVNDEEDLAFADSLAVERGL